MRTSLKVTILVTVIVFALALPVIVVFIYPQSYVSIATRLIHSSSGYEVELSGIEVDSFPLKLVLSDLRVINPSIDSVDPVLTVNKFDASVSLWGYFQGETNWWQAAAAGVTARYAVDERGQNNWATNPESGPSSTADDSTDDSTENPGISEDGGNDLLLSFDSLSVADFEYIQSTEGRTERLQIANLILNKNQDESVNLSLQGSYQDKPLTLSGRLPLPNSDQAREVDIDASLFGSNWRIAGRVGHDGITQANVDISLQASDLSALTALTNIDFSSFTPINLHGTVEAPSLTQWISSITGQFGEQNLQLDGSLTLDESKYILEEFVLDAGFVSMKGVGRIDPDAHSVAAELDIGRLDVDQLLAFLKLPIQTGAESIPKPVASEPAESKENGEADDPVAALRDQLASAAEMLNPWSVDIHGKLDKLIISGNQLTGLTLDATTEGAKLQVAAQLQSVDAVQASQSQPSGFQTFLPLRISAEILLEPKRVQMSDLELNFNGDDVRGELLADLTQERPNLAGELKIDRLNVEQILSTLNPDPKAKELTQTSSLDSGLNQTEKAEKTEKTEKTEETEETERLNALRVQLLSAIEVLDSLSLDIHTKINTVEVSGVLLSSLSVDAVSDGAKLEISAALKNVATVSASEAAGDRQSELQSLQSVLPLEVSAELLLEPERVAMNKLNMNMGGNTAQGQLLADLSGEIVHLEAELNILFKQLNVDQLLSVLDSNVSANSANSRQSETVETDAITALKSQLVSAVEILNRLSLDVHSEFDSLVVSGYQLTNFKADAKSDGANMELSAALENLNLTEDSVSAPANGSKSQQNDFQTILPLTFAAEVSIEPERVVVNELEINMDGDTVQGELVADLSGKILNLDGQLSADRIDLDKFTATSAEDLNLEGKGTASDEDNQAKNNQAEDNQDVIGDQAIDWSWLSAANLRFDITSGLIRVNKTDFRNLAIELSMQDRTLIVDPISADLAQGGIRGDIKIEPLEFGAAIVANIIATELTPADLGQPDKGLIDGGEADLVIELTTRGNTAQELASALNGEITLEVQRATVRNNLFELIGSDVLTQFIDLINPFAKDDDQTELECAAIHFVAESGILTSRDQLAIETSKMIIRGGGVINLNDETLQIDFVPSARSGLGVSLSSLVNVVRLGGTLSSPSPEVDPKGVLRSGANIGAAIATGGLSLLAKGLFDRARNTMTSCGKIFEENTELPAALKTPDAVAPGTDTPDPR